jgi:putative colanic acid biosynthesis acetyltransferase WcaF
VTHPAIDLGAHSGRLYDKGRSFVWQALWHVTSHLIFQKWWFPSRFRPALLRAFGATIGDNVVIRQDVRIHWPWRLVIGGPAWIGHGAWILNLAEVVIEPNVCLSQEALLCTGSHDRKDVAFEHANAPIHVERGAWVCARATLLPGATVGDHAIVPAGSVVRGHVAPFSISGQAVPANTDIVPVAPIDGRETEARTGGAERRPSE